MHILVFDSLKIRDLFCRSCTKSKIRKLEPCKSVDICFISTNAVVLFIIFADCMWIQILSAQGFNSETVMWVWINIELIIVDTDPNFCICTDYKGRGPENHRGVHHLNILLGASLQVPTPLILFLIMSCSKAFGILVIVPIVYKRNLYFFPSRSFGILT